MMAKSLAHSSPNHDSRIAALTYRWEHVITALPITGISTQTQPIAILNDRLVIEISPPYLLRAKQLWYGTDLLRKIELTLNSSEVQSIHWRATASLVSDKQLERIVQHWPKIVGTEMSRHSVPLKILHNTRTASESRILRLTARLLVLTDTSASIQAIGTMEPTIVANLQTIEPTIIGLHLRIQQHTATTLNLEDHDH